MAKYTRFDPRNKKKDRHKQQYQGFTVKVKREEPKKDTWTDGTVRVK